MQQEWNYFFYFDNFCKYWKMFVHYPQFVTGMILQLVDFRLYYVAPQFILLMQSCIYVSEKWSTEMCTYHMWLCTGDSVHHTQRRKYQIRTDRTVLCRPGCKTRSYCSRSSIVSQWLHLENKPKCDKGSSFMHERMLLTGRPILCLLVGPAQRPAVLCAPSVRMLTR